MLHNALMDTMDLTLLKFANKNAGTLAQQIGSTCSLTLKDNFVWIYALHILSLHLEKRSTTPVSKPCIVQMKPGQKSK